MSSPIISGRTSQSRPPEDQLASSPSLLALMECVPDAVVCVDRNWNFTFANQFAITLLNAGPLIGEHLWTLFPGNNAEPYNSSYRTTMERGTPTEFEAYYPAPLDLWFKAFARPFGDGIIIFFSDITAQKKAEISRDEANRRLQFVFASSPDSIICIDRNWNCSFANLAAKLILKTDQLVGANLWTAFPLNQSEPFASNYRTTMERGIPTEFEAYYPAPLDIWFKVYARPFEDGIIIFSSDISARKKAEARRDSITRRLEQAFEATTDAVASLSRDWTYTFLNRRAEELLAMKGDLVGKNIWEEFPSARDTDFFINYTRTMEERVPTEFEAYYAEPLNLWLNVSCRPSDDGIVVFFRDVTEERAARQALLDQRDTLAFVQETARVATWEIDFATNAMTFGPGSYPVFGRPLDTIRSVEDFRAIVLPEHLPRVQESTRHALKTGEVTTVDYQVIVPLAEGETEARTLWVEGRGIPIRDVNGNATHLRGMTTDITARRQNLDELSASEERYRVLADLNPQAIWMGSPDGRITYANQGFLDYIGFTMEQASVSMEWIKAFYVEEHTRVIDAWTHAIATGTEYDIEARMIRASDGAVRWWWLRALPIRDDSGKILNWLGVATEIHDRKTHAEELYRQHLETERQRAELETLYATAPIGLALFDPIDFRYLRLNQLQASFFGMTPSEVLGKTLTEMAPIPGLRELFEEVRDGRPVLNHILEGKVATDPPDTKRFWTVNYLPVYGPDGKVQAITAASHEITHIKKAEAALVQSEKLAAVGRLASSISHEINNPLEAITNILYLIDHDSTLTETVRPLVNMAQSELSRVCQIATQTLRFHRQAVRATHVTAENLVGAVLNLYQGRLANTGIAVQAVYASSSPILCFENDIRQVLNNLIANAIDAMRQNGGRLIVRAHDTSYCEPGNPSAKPVAAVRITIADTGHGMTPEVRARIFEPFYTTKDLNGTGLGLWISAGIVARHKGHLTLRSSTHPVHRGTIFTLTLPTEDQPTQSVN